MTVTLMSSTRRRLLQGGIGAGLGGFAGCASNQSAAPGTSEQETGTDSKTVAVGPDGRYVFTPGTETSLRIAPGTTVKFVWKSDTHNIYVDSQPKGANWQGHEPIEDTGFTYEYTFEVTGAYHYWCEPHKSLGMVADLVVE